MMGMGGVRVRWFKWDCLAHPEDIHLHVKRVGKVQWWKAEDGMARLLQTSPAHLSRSRTLPSPMHSLLPSTGAWTPRMSETGGVGREPPDRSTKARSAPRSFRPLAKKNSNARYSSSSQTVVNRCALLVHCTASPKKHKPSSKRVKDARVATF